MPAQKATPAGLGQFRVLGFRVWGLGFGLGFKVLGFRV